MKYELSELETRVIKQSLLAHLKQCEEFIKLDDKVATFSVIERTGVEEKVRVIKFLLENM